MDASTSSTGNGFRDTSIWGKGRIVGVNLLIERKSAEWTHRPLPVPQSNTGPPMLSSHITLQRPTEFPDGDIAAVLWERCF